MGLIHPTAIIDPKATLASSVTVGPYAVIGAGVVDAAAIGLDLERNSAGREHIEDLAGMRHAERLARVGGPPLR